MPYIGNQHNVGDHVNNFKVLDDISSHTATFDGSATSVVDTTNNTIRVPEHRFIQGQRVTYTNGGGGNIGGLTTGTAYYVSFDTANTIKLATTLANANSNTVINLSAVGSGTSHTLNAAFDGVNTKFKMTHGSGKSARLNNATQLNVAINNVIQRPNLDPNNFTDGFALQDNHKIVFKTAPTVNDVFWGSIIANTIENFDLRDNEVDNFTGDGSTTEFTLSTIPANNESVIVSINGVVQHPSDKNTARSYTLIDSIIQFTAAPALGDGIQVRHIGFAGASTNDVSGFYGRTGNVALTSSDHITTGDITPRNINSSGIVTATTFDGAFSSGVGGSNANFTGIVTAGVFKGGDFDGRNLNISGIATFAGDVSIGGTLTYEDVTNIDSVGIITAQKDIHVGAGLSVVGIVTAATGDFFDLDVDGHTNLDNVSVVGVTTITANNVIGLNVENSAGGGAQTTIRSKSTVANASNFVRSESSDNKYIGLLKYGTGHSAYGALAAGGGAVYANSSVPITIMSDGGYINFATGGNLERLRIASNGTVGIGGTTIPGALLDLSAAVPSILFSETGVSANNGKWLNAANASELYWQAQTDAHSGGGNLFKMTRSNQEIQSFEGQQAGATWFTVRNSDKRVGIGSAIPEQKLKINVTSGNDGMVVQNTSTANIALIGARNGDATLQIGQYGSTASGNVFGIAAANLAFMYTTSYASTHPSALLIGNSSNKDIIFATNATARVRIHDTGQVTIGALASTTVASGILHTKVSNTTSPVVFENDTENADVVIRTTGTNKHSVLGFGDGADNFIGNIDYDHQNNNMVFDTSGSERLRIGSSGVITQVETGTGNGSGGIRASTASAGGNAGFGFITGGTQRFSVTTIGSAGSESLRVYDVNNSAERFRITSTGLIRMGNGAQANTESHITAAIFQNVTGTATILKLGNTNTPSSANNRAIEFCDGTGGTEGSSKYTYARIKAERTGGSNAGRLIFSTKPDNSSGPQKAFEITPDGDVLIGNGGVTTQEGDGRLIVYANTRLHPAIKADCIDGGSNRANGFTMLADNYGADESLTNIGVSYSGSGLVLSRGVKVSNSADNAYLSSVDSFATQPCALKLDNGGNLTFSSTNTSATTTTDSAVTLYERFRIMANGRMGVGTNNPQFMIHTEGSGNNGGVRLENSHTTTTVSGNTAAGAFPHNLILSNYGGSGNADNRLVSLGFDVPTTGNHANAAIVYQATASNGTGDLQFWLENGNTIYERARFTSAGQFVMGTTSSSGARMIIQQNSSDTNPLDQNTSADSSGVRIQNYSFGTGRYTALSLEACNSSSVQSASIIAQSVASGTSPDIIIAQRTSIGANTERVRITSDGEVHLSTAGYEFTENTFRSKVSQSVGNNNPAVLSGAMTSVEGSKHSWNNTGGILDLPDYKRSDWQILEVYGEVNPNSGGSGVYSDPFFMIIYQGYGWNGSAVTSYIYAQQFSPMARDVFPSGTGNSGADGMSVVWYDGSNETNNCAYNSTTHYLRIKLDTGSFNTTNGCAASVRIFRRF